MWVFFALIKLWSITVLCLASIISLVICTLHLYKLHQKPIIIKKCRTILAVLFTKVVLLFFFYREMRKKKKIVCCQSGQVTERLIFIQEEEERRGWTSWHLSNVCSGAWCTLPDAMREQWIWVCVCVFSVQLSQSEMKRDNELTHLHDKFTSKSSVR